MRYSRIGDCVILVDRRNYDLTVTRLLGINIKKEFMPTAANQLELDLSNYKIICKNQFAYSAMQVGRDETVRVGLFTDIENAIISPAYLVFELINIEEILPEYLMMIFKRPEFDRYGWFISDGSVRSSLEWDRFCDISIPIPSIDKQKHIVALYSSILNHRSILKSINSLMLKYSDIEVEQYYLSSKMDNIGNYIRLIDERNINCEYSNVKGINIKKCFIPTVANTTDTDLSKYKIIRPNQFAYSAMQVGRDEVIRVALYQNEKPAIISPAYIVFDIIDINIIKPEYLFMCFMRKEFDRYGWFLSDGSVRSSLEWDRFCEIEIPIPEIEQQASLLQIHNARINYNNSILIIDNVISSLCSVLIRGLVNKE